MAHGMWPVTTTCVHLPNIDVIRFPLIDCQCQIERSGLDIRSSHCYLDQLTVNKQLMVITGERIIQKRISFIVNIFAVGE